MGSCTGSEMMSQGLVVYLTSSNWNYWSSNIRPLLRMNECLDTVDKKDKPDAIAQDKWDKACHKAAYHIKCRLTEEMMNKVSDIDSPYEIYKTLKESFEGTGMDKGIKLVARLNQISSNFPGLSAVVSNISQLKNEFTTHFDFTKDDFWVAYTLHSLPQQYDQLRVALKTKDALTLDQLKTFLNQEAMREQQNTATLAKMNTRQSDFCLVCGRNNHRTENCRQRKTEPVASSNNKGGQKNGKNKKKGGKENDNSKGVSGISANLITRERCKLNFINKSSEGSWIIDSGATHHVAISPNHVQNVIDRSDVLLESASGSDLGATGVGQTDIQMNSTPLNLKDVILAPDLNANFLSVSKLVKADFVVTFFKHKGSCKATLIHNDKLIGEAVEKNGLFELKNVVPKLCNITVQSSSNNPTALISNWHRKLGHVNFDDLLRLKTTLGISSNGSKLDCETCNVAKCHRLPFQKRTIKSKTPLELIHSDTSGTIRTPNIHRYTSYVIFIDDFTRYTFIYLLKSKNEVLEKFKQFKTMIENQLDHKIKAFRSDNGTEFTNNAFKQFCTSNGIRLETSNTDTPQQNGVAERMNRTIRESATALLTDMNVSPFFWPYAVHTSVYNR